ncbi:hypothetical protein I6F35_07570 [Bradyrhizobium sp. BRP22]|uniref:hypothetical protein n=1 Tax=Bradyrhizobium sp. BRP22 TaxID=2793821 RepID=UPI0031FE0DD7|nr:hypothetical protein [Bradyrhizobium sp. BRP22]
MQQIVRRCAIDVGQATVGIGLKIEASDQVEQALIGMVRDVNGHSLSSKASM